MSIVVQPVYALIAVVILALYLLDLEVQLLQIRRLMRDILLQCLLLCDEGLFCFLLLLDLVIKGLSVSDQLVKVSFQVLHCFAQVVVVLGKTHGLVTVLHVVLLESFDLVFLVFFDFLHLLELGFDLAVEFLFLPDFILTSI